MSSIVPYARSVSSFVRPRSNPYLSLGKFAWNNRDVIMRYAKRFNRKRKWALAYRKRKRAKYTTRAIGNRPGGEATKKAAVISKPGGTLEESVSLQSRNLYVTPLIEIEHTTINAPNRRQRNIVNVRGIKLCFEIMNIGDGPLYFNWAIIASKKGGAPTTADFFRNVDSSATRSTDFPNGAGMSGIQMWCATINTDIYTVLCHKRYRIGTSNNGLSQYAQQVQNNNKSVRKYMKIRRQLRFDGDLDNEPSEGQLYLVKWMAPYNTSSLVGKSVVATWTAHSHVYFREPKC